MIDAASICRRGEHICNGNCFRKILCHTGRDYNLLSVAYGYHHAVTIAFASSDKEL